jgi:misacylated tRNA(Ala) deacylase
VLLWQGVETRIVGTRTGDELYLVPADGDPVPPAGTAVRGAVEELRRTSLMRTHSGLHVVCGVIFRDFQALATGSNMEPLVGRIDFNLPEVPAGFKIDVEAAINTEILADRAIVARVLPRAEAMAIPDVVKTQTDLVPPDVTEVRIVDVVGLDLQTDGGTHVASTRQIGRVEVVKVESKGRQNRRLRLRVHD